MLFLRQIPPGAPNILVKVFLGQIKYYNKANKNDLDFVIVDLFMDCCKFNPQGNT